MEKQKERKFEKVEAEINFWKAENIGDSLEGEFIDFFDGKYGEQPIIKTEEDISYVVPTAKQLTTLLKECNVGDWLRITYVAEKEVGKAQPLKLFSVEREVSE